MNYALVLGNFAVESIVPALLQGLRDENYEVCREAAYALREIGSKKAPEGMALS